MRWGREGNKAVGMWLWGIGEGVERAHGWSNSVMGHSGHGSEGNKAVGRRLWCTRKGYGGKQGGVNAVMEH